MQQLPQGWALHPSDSRYAYEVANPSHMKPVSELQQAAAGPYRAPAPPAPSPWVDHPNAPGYEYNQQTNEVRQKAAAAPATPAAPYDPFSDVPGATEGPDGSMDMDAWAKQQEAAARSARGWGSREKKWVWLDFEKVHRTGDESVLHVRMLPDRFRNDQSGLCPPVSRHRMFGEYIEGHEKKFAFIPCFNNEGGGGNCPICKVIEHVKASGVPGGGEHVDNFKPETQFVWQCIHLDDIQKHYVQEVDDAGNPVTDPQTGGPKWKMVPAIHRAKKTLQDDIIELMRHKGPPAHTTHGYALKLIRRKTGPEQFNVEYKAVDMTPEPLDPRYYPILENVVDLKQAFYTDAFWERDKVQKVADAICARFNITPLFGGGGDDGETWLPHPGMPGYEYNPATNQVRPMRAPAAAAPPAGPPAYTPPAAPAPAPGFPPTAAAGMPPAAPPAAGPPPGAPNPPPAPGGAPPALPPAPGAPPGPPAAAGAPPGPPAPPRPGMPAPGAPGLPPAPPAASPGPPPPPPGGTPGAALPGPPVGGPPAPPAGPPAPPAGGPPSPPAGPPAGPPGPPPAPGMPSGAAPAAAGGMSPEQLESSLGNGKQEGLPF